VDRLVIPNSPRDDGSASRPLTPSRVGDDPPRTQRKAGVRLWMLPLENRDQNRCLEEIQVGTVRMHNRITSHHRPLIRIPTSIRFCWFSARDSPHESPSDVGVKTRRRKAIEQVTCLAINLQRRSAPSRTTAKLRNETPSTRTSSRRGAVRHSPQGVRLWSEVWVRPDGK